jgi:tetratricopeptide (TPR) repeat protein
MPVSRKWIVVLACFIAALAWMGCSTEGSEQTRTERLRLSLDPRAGSFMRQASEAAQAGFQLEALAFADSAERYEPELADAPYLRGVVYTSMNQFADARREFERVIELDPEYPGARMNIADNELSLGRFREALVLYREEEEVAPSSALYEGMGRAYDELNVADSARVAYEKAITLDSTNASAHMLLGQLYEEGGDIEQALAYSRKALALQPQSANYQFAVGSQLFRLDRLEEATGYLKQAADAETPHYPAQYNLGQVLMRLGREDEANFYLEKADSTRRFMSEITLAEEALTRNPQDVESWEKLGGLYQESGMYTQAFEAYNRAASLQPSNLSLQHRVAQTVMASGNTTGAIEIFEAILRADPSQVDVRLDLGLAYAVAGQCAPARRNWETALQQRPGDATARNYLSGLCQYTAAQ